MYYQITSEDGENIWIGNDKAVIDFVNTMNEGADELLNDINDAIEWLENEGFEVERRKDLTKRMDDGELIYIK